MRFQRFPRHHNTDQTPSARRLAIARRAVMADHDRNALTPELVTHQTAEARLAGMDRDRAAYWQHLRNYNARTWRDARRRFRALAPELRAQVQSIWTRPGFPLPGAAGYFADLITQTERAPR